MMTGTNRGWTVFATAIAISTLLGCGHGGSQPGVTVTESAGSTDVTEGGATDTYTVVLDSQPTADVTISVSTDSQVSVSPTSLTFTSADWDVPQTVTVTAVDDSVPEASPHTGVVSHAASSGDGNYDAIAVGSVSANITDDDLAVVAFYGANGFVPKRGVYKYESGTLSVIADNTTVIPDGGTDTFTGFAGNQSSIGVSNGTFVFYGEGAGKRGIYMYDGASYSVIADTSTVIPDGGTDMFSTFGQVAISGGTVVFAAENGSVPKNGVYKYESGTLSVIADNNTTIPDGGTDMFSSFYGAIAVDGPLVVFYGENGGVGKRGIYSSTGGTLAVVADSSTVIPDGGSDLFANFGTSKRSIAVSGSTIVFGGENGLVPKRGIYQYDGASLSVVADNTTTIPDGGTDLFNGFRGAVAVDGPLVVFYGENGLVAKRGIYSSVGGTLAVVADSDTVIPDGGSDLFAGFEDTKSAVGIAGNHIVFTGSNGVVPKRGVYRYDGTALSVVADNNTTIPDGGTDLFAGFAGAVAIE